MKDKTETKEEEEENKNDRGQNKRIKEIISDSRRTSHACHTHTRHNIQNSPT